MLKRLICDGLYPTHPLFESLPLILGFEIIVVALEFLVMYTLLGALEKKEGKITGFTLWLLVITANVVSFIAGLTIQIIIVTGS